MTRLVLPYFPCPQVTATRNKGSLGDIIIKLVLVEGNSVNTLQPLAIFSIFLILKPPYFKNTFCYFIVLSCLTLDSVRLASTCLSVIVNFVTDCKGIYYSAN